MFGASHGETLVGTVNTEVTETTQACKRVKESQHIFFFSLHVPSIQLPLQDFLDHSSYEISLLKSMAFVEEPVGRNTCCFI